MRLTEGERAWLRREFVDGGLHCSCGLAFAADDGVNAFDGLGREELLAGFDAYPGFSGNSRRGSNFDGGGTAVLRTGR